MICLTTEEFNQMELEIKEAQQGITELRRKLRLGVSGKLSAEDPELILLDKLFELMNKHNCDMDTAELLLQDEREGGGAVCED